MKSPGHHLLVRRSLQPDEKGTLELAFYRCWSARPATLAMLAHAFLAITARDSRQQAPPGPAPASGNDPGAPAKKGT